MVALRESVFENLSKPAYVLTDRIAALEAAAGVSFPEAYKSAIGALDGMLLKKGELRWGGKGESPHFTRVEAFLTFAREDDGATDPDEDDGVRQDFSDMASIFGIEEQLARVKAEGADGLIPFAIDDDGGLFCFDFRSDTSPVPIVFLDSEDALEESWLCASFEEFMAALEAGDAD